MRLNPFTFLKRPLRTSGRKAPAMPDVSPTPPAPAGGADRLGVLVDAIGRLADQQRSLLDALKPTQAAPAAQPASPATSADSIRAMVTEILKEQQVTATRSAARSAYAREHLADLPEAYRRLLPETDDAAVLSAAEQDLRRQFRQDLKGLIRSTGEPAGAEIGGDSPGGLPPAAAIDYAKLSPLQQIAVGLRGKTPAARINPPKSGKLASAAAADDAGNDAVADDSWDDAALFVGAD
jgi:hypothetical protein